jgi:hypothetical protein
VTGGRFLLNYREQRMSAGKTTKLTRVFSGNLIAATQLCFVALGTLWVISECERADTELEKFRSEFTAAQKERIQSQVDNVVDFIEFKKSQTAARWKCFNPVTVRLGW